MRRIAEGFELPSDWGCFTNVGMTLDTVDQLFGNGSAKYDAANVEYATAPLLTSWNSFLISVGLHFKMENVATVSPNWIFGWRSSDPVVEAGAIGILDSKLVFGRGGTFGGAEPEIVATGRRTLLDDTLYHIGCEIWHSLTLGWVKIRINDRVIADLVFNGPAQSGSTTPLIGVWIGSPYGGGDGECWIDDFVLNDQQQFQSQDFRSPGMLIIQSVPSDVEGTYGDFIGADNDEQQAEAVLNDPEADEALGVAGTPISCNNELSATVGCVVSAEGPLTNPTFENQTSGESVSFGASSVPSGSTLHVNTDDETAILTTPGPGASLITEDWSPFITGSPVWFRLATGSNSINVSGGVGAVTVGWVEYEVGPKDSFTFDPKPSAPVAPTGSAGLVAVDHVYRMQLVRLSEAAFMDKLIPGVRRSSSEAWAPEEEAHLFPTDVMACHIDRMRRDRLTDTVWDPSEIDTTQAVFQYSNYNESEHE